MSRFSAPSRLLRAACPALCLVAAVLLGLGSRAALAQPVPGENEIVVANEGNLEGQGQSITVYARTANGNVAPTRTIGSIYLGNPAGLAVDRVNNEVVVLDGISLFSGYGSVQVYALSANGNVAPLRTIAGPTAGLRGPWGLALDTINNELVVANGELTTGELASLKIFARTANGDVAALRTIAGAATGLSRPVGPAVDTVNDELVVANLYINSITVYARTATGNVAPLRTIAGPATGLNNPIGLAVDTMHDELLVANLGGSSINVYARTANGNVAPLRTITGLNSPGAVAVDTVNDELAVAGFFYPGSVSVYARTGGTLKRTIAGPDTGLYVPVGLAINSSSVPTITSLIASPAPPVVPGTPITWTATATGGVAPLQYAFYLYTAATNSWTEEQAYSTTNTWNWTPPQEDQYAVQVWVRNNGSTAPYDAWRSSGFFNIGTSGPPPTINSLTANPALPQPPGTAITWTAMASGGLAPLQYEFLLYTGATATWSVARAYSTTNIWAWTPSQAGLYAVQVWVKNNGSVAPYDAWKGSGFFNIGTSSPPPTIPSLTASPPLPQPAGTAITWTAMATGGAAPLQYEFLLYTGATATWSVARAYSTTNTWSWTPSQAGQYAVQVWVKNNGSVAPYDAWRSSGFFNVTP